MKKDSFYFLLEQKVRVYKHEEVRTSFQTYLLMESSTLFLVLFGHICSKIPFTIIAVAMYHLIGKTLLLYIIQIFFLNLRIFRTI